MAEGEERRGARSWSRRTGLLAALTLLSAAAVHAEQPALLALAPGGAEAEARGEDTLGNFLPEVWIGWTSNEPKIGDPQDELSLIGGGGDPASESSGGGFQLPRPQFSVTLGSDSSGRRNRGLALEWRLQGPPLLDGTLGFSIRGKLDTFGFHYKLTF